MWVPAETSGRAKHGKLYIWRIGNHGKAASHQSLRFRAGKGEEMERGALEPSGPGWENGKLGIEIRLLFMNIFSFLRGLDCLNNTHLWRVAQDLHTFQETCVGSVSGLCHNMTGGINQDH